MASLARRCPNQLVRIAIQDERTTARRCLRAVDGPATWRSASVLSKTSSASRAYGRAACLSPIIRTSDFHTSSSRLILPAPPRERLFFDV